MLEIYSVFFFDFSASSCVVEIPNGGLASKKMIATQKKEKVKKKYKFFNIFMIFQHLRNSWKHLRTSRKLRRYAAACNDL